MCSLAGYDELSDMMQTLAIPMITIKWSHATKSKSPEQLPQKFGISNNSLEQN